MQPGVDPRAGVPLVVGHGGSLAQLLTGKSYHLDYFQRRFVWEKDQIVKLVQDLTKKFSSQWSAQHPLNQVRNYYPYFLGPFITYTKSGRLFLADGQQRFVSIALLLFYLRRLLLDQEEDAIASSVTVALSSNQYGETTFVVHDDDYQACFEALMNNRQYNTDGAAPYMGLVWEASQHIKDSLPDDIRGEGLKYFASWLLHRVSLVEIDAGDDSQAWEVFQSINDRGVHLKPIDHLKGYLINDADAAQRPALEDAWRRMVNRLEQLETGAAFGFIQAVLRARFAKIDNASTASTKGPELSKATHEWVRAHADDIVPSRKDGDLASLIPRLFVPLGDTYLRLLRAKQKLTKGLEAVYFNAENGISQQFDLAIASIQLNDSESVKTRKLQAVANFIDLFVVQNAVNNRAYGQEVLDELVLRVLSSARRAQTIEDLQTALAPELDGLDSDWQSLENLRLSDKNSQFIHYLLARLTAWLEAGVENGDHRDLVGNYLSKKAGKRTYQIEHLFPSSNEAYKSLIWNLDEYRMWRSRVGALVLLHGSENAGLGGLPLAEKVGPYCHFNLLAASLHESTYTIRGMARFRRFVREQKLQGIFRAYRVGEPFTDLIEDRGRLLRAMCERIWNAEVLGLVVSGTPQGPKSAQRKKRTRTNYGVDLETLLLAKLLNEGDVLVGQNRGQVCRAVVLADGRIRTASQCAFDSPSAAAMDALNRSSFNGWPFWRLESNGVSLDKLRSQYLIGK